MNDTAYSLDDVLLEPQYSTIKSRLNTNVSTALTKHCVIDIPIMATNMSTVTEYSMMKAMNDLGGVGALHRFLSTESQTAIVSEAVKNHLYPIVASIGIGDNEFTRAEALIDAGAQIIMVDVAHGHCEGVNNQLYELKDKYPSIDVIVGNIATEQAVTDFCNWGADAIRVGIGGGARCTTRTVTGHGVPNLTALVNTVKARNDYHSRTGVYVPIIIDGGIKNSGDIVKALYFGADVACIGNLIAGTDETPGEIIHGAQGKVKKYYGMASKDAQDTHRGGMKSGTAAEGFSSSVPYKGSVIPIIEELVGGIRSGLTYSNAKDINELRRKGRVMYLTPASQSESKLR